MPDSSFFMNTQFEKYVKFGTDVFGAANMLDPDTRMERLLEEVFELAQAHGVSLEEIRRVAEFAYNKEPGPVAEEAADVLFTLVAYGSSQGVDFEHECATKMEAVINKHAFFKLRGEQKTPIVGVS